MGIWYKYKRTFTEPNDIHNEEAMFKGTCIAEFDLDQDPQSALKNKMGNFDEADIHQTYSQSQGKDDETLTIASRLCQIGKKIQAQTSK